MNKDFQQLNQGLPEFLEQAESPVSASKQELLQFQNQLFIVYRRVYRHGQAIAKRSLDIIGSAVGLILLSPLLIATALIIRFESKGNILFSQYRVGKAGTEFKMWKFRSMYSDSERRKAALLEENEMSGGVIFKMKQDPRITKTGRIIRKFSIDELPQLWNVLCGNMSLVGPRPALAQEVAQYSLLDRQRLIAKPGITCLWQVSGRSDIPFDQQVELDRRYSCETSLATDLKLLALTIPAVLRAKGAY